MKKKVEKNPILVAYADDHRLVRETIVRFLEELGGIKVIIQADNGKELIQKLSQSAITPDVCIVDIVMPEMNGFDTVINLKSDKNDMKILILSGHISEEYFIKMLFVGADGYLTKNQSPEQIKKAVLDVHQFGFCNMEHFSHEFIQAVRHKGLDVIIPALSAKELQLLRLSIEDKTYEEIAVLTNQTAKGIEGHRKKLFEKLGVKTRAGLVIYALQYGYATLNPSPRL